MKKISNIALLVMLSWSQIAGAEGVLGLDEFLRNEIISLDAIFSDLGDASANMNPLLETGEDYMFRRFWFRLRGKVGLKAPGLAGLEVIPEVEMLWEKEVPDGWAIYKP